MTDLHEIRAGVDSLTLTELLSGAHQRLTRLTAVELHAAMANADALVLDTRTPTDRTLYGCIPGAIHTPLHVVAPTDDEIGIRTDDSQYVGGNPDAVTPQG